MHPIQGRVGGLLVVTGFVLAFTIRAGWAMLVGPALLVFGGLVLALAAEPLVAETSSAGKSDDVAEVVERPGGMAA